MSRRVAYGGILLAINIILLLLTNIIPINTLFLMGLASLPISIVIMEFGPSTGIGFYIGSVILGYLVMTSKAQWLLYACTFGVYGIIKYAIERDRPIFIEMILKLLFANIVMIILSILLNAFVYIPINLISILTFQVIFIVYDYMYTSFIDYYNTKIKKIIKNL